MPPFSNEQVAHLVQFIGYGNTNAPCCFCGLEEGGGGVENLRTRLNFQPIMDRRLAYQRLHMDEQIGKFQHTVTKMAKIALAVERGETPDRAETTRYQADSLGRAAGRTLMTELWPLPKPDFGSWPDEYTTQFVGRGWDSAISYRNSIRQERIQILRPVLTSPQRRVIVFYGKGSWDDFLQFLGADCPQQVDGTDSHVRMSWFTPERGKANSILLVLTHHLSRVTYQQAVDIGLGIRQRLGGRRC